MGKGFIFSREFFVRSVGTELDHNLRIYLICILNLPQNATDFKYFPEVGGGEPRYPPYTEVGFNDPMATTIPLSTPGSVFVSNIKGVWRWGGGVI